MTQPNLTVWVRSQPDPVTGDYLLTIDYAEDASVALTEAEGIDYARGFFAAITRADYQAAILTQMQKVTDDRDDALLVLSDFREATQNLFRAGPLALVPGVAMDNGKYVGFVEVTPDKGDSWTWRGEEVRGHATGVIEVALGVDLDQAYLQTLVEKVGLDEGRARNVVQDIMNYRDAPWQDPALLEPKEK